jgi:hypothetical protein
MFKGHAVQKQHLNFVISSGLDIQTPLVFPSLMQNPCICIIHLAFNHGFKLTSRTILITHRLIFIMSKGLIIDFSLRLTKIMKSSITSTQASED